MISVVDAFRAVTRNPQRNYVAAIEDSGGLFQRFEVTTPLRVAHFLAQVLHETGGGQVLFESLRYTTPARLLEIFGVGNHSAAVRPEELPGLLGNEQALAERVYGLGNPGKAQELGNTRPGDGFRYRGGGLLQTTGGGAYRRMSDLTGVDFHADPERIVAAEHALKPALHEWGEGGLNRFADANDIRTITKRINGGFNGLAERQRWLEAVWPVVSGDAPPPWQAGRPDDETTWLQDALNALGARPPLVVDGRYGPATIEAVKQFQSVAGLRVDGIAGDVTRAAIRLRLATIRGG